MKVNTDMLMHQQESLHIPFLRSVVAKQLYRGVQKVVTLPNLVVYTVRSTVESELRGRLGR
jgi:NADH:ubiquinone oxidoreductase subunit F (NADH-binding)